MKIAVKRIVVFALKEVVKIAFAIFIGQM